ncbi:MAG: 2-dehydropantoate 2-reductase [Chloroflexi bacterium]|nr:2-dehydropantoate 2-reductase [Chloroflexota bacterium]MCI0579011.1 2-dehydropantoate 2-reductase [Chloroflexota bacterium]MCI0644798.1 2-dehydropantoate 2-reductase [Chloroflexota bacterium]MCI0731973.1 2-dehydropantoate 2-reductase [Chloroflexota bacterium]
MDVLVFGAGAVGGYLGACLANAGHNVTLVVRGTAADLITEHGLTVAEGEQRHTVRPALVTSLRQAFLDRVTYDLILMAMKSYDVEPAINELVAFCPSPPPLITLQNGIGIEELFVKEFGPERVIAGSLTTPISREAGNSLVIQRSDRGLALAPVQPGQKMGRWFNLFQAAGVPTVALKDFRSMKWSKAMLNMIGNATAAILNRHPRVVYGYTPTFRLEVVMLRETLAVMRKLKLKPVDLPGAPTGLLVFAIQRLPLGLVQPFLSRVVSSGRGDKMPSFHIDLAAGRQKSEVFYHNGAVARYGQSVGVPTPVNTALNDILLKLARKEIDYEIFNGNPKRLVAEVRRYQQEAKHL